MTVFIGTSRAKRGETVGAAPGVVNRQTAVIVNIVSRGGIRTQFSAQVRPGPGPVTS
jgi:hypothetical protein